MIFAVERVDRFQVRLCARVVTQNISTPSGPWTLVVHPSERAL